MKRSLILALALTVAFAFTFTGCGSSGDSKDSSSADSGVQDELSVDKENTDLSADPEPADQPSEADNSDSAQPKDETTANGTNANTPAAGTEAKPVQKPSADKNQGSTQASGGSGASTKPAQSGGGSEAGAKTPSKATAQSYIGKSASSMIAAMGSPTSSQYSPSCMGDGEDGELYYDGFTVYTYRENGQEKVMDVE